MLKVGLTGGIGAGKSVVARRLAEHGAVIIDSDLLARQVVAAGTNGQAEVVEAFGPEVLGPDGELDRPALGARVFGDDAARRRLEGLIHPRVRARAAELTAAAGPEAVVVNDVPLLVETGLVPSYHLVVVVEADTGTRVKRLAETRGMPVDQAEARIAAQASDEERRAAADVVLDNDADLADLNARIDRLWWDRIAPYEENLRARRIAARSGTARIVEYDPAWPRHAARLMARIRHSAGDAVVLDHIGSTAVPGLPSADLIDLMLTVRTLAEADALAAALTAAGLPRRPGEWVDEARGTPGDTWPKRMHGNADPGRMVNVHVRVAGSPAWRFALLVRDHLRAVPQAREAFGGHKAAWASQYPDRGQYAEMREPWFRAEAKAAYAWAEETGWQPA